jgi:hypothetical protein
MEECIASIFSVEKSTLTDFSVLKMEAMRSSETFHFTGSAWHHIPEDGILSTELFH